VKAILECKLQLLEALNPEGIRQPAGLFGPQGLIQSLVLQ
jgi:hypothetical protein